MGSGDVARRALAYAPVPRTPPSVLTASCSWSGGPGT